MKIVLLGYMGSGKSTIGRNLANEIQLPFVDLDDYIREKESKTISTIFKEKGEIYFRKVEHQYLKEILNFNVSFVLSLGGGTPCYANNMDVIKNSDTVSFYLQASIKTLVNRLLKEKNQRPLIATLEDDKVDEFVAKHLFERNSFYQEADFTIKTDDTSTSEIVRELKKCSNL